MSAVVLLLLRSVRDGRSACWPSFAHLRRARPVLVNMADSRFLGADDLNGNHVFRVRRIKSRFVDGDATLVSSTPTAYPTSRVPVPSSKTWQTLVLVLPIISKMARSGARLDRNSDMRFIVNPPPLTRRQRRGGPRRDGGPLFFSWKRRASIPTGHPDFGWLQSNALVGRTLMTSYDVPMERLIELPPGEGFCMALLGRRVDV